jgi:hypothetical protein
LSGEFIDSSNYISVVSNNNLLTGWTLKRKEYPRVDSRSIARSWIYNTKTLTKLVDLDVIDLNSGILPGGIAKNIDYISGVDPANYNVDRWISKKSYKVNDRVQYDGKVYIAVSASSSATFNYSNWSLWPTATSSYTLTSSSTKWGADQVGKIWFNTRGIRTIDSNQGTLEDKITIANKWLPNTSLIVSEWISSTVAPSNYTGSGTPNVEYVYDEYTKLYYYWVSNKTSAGPVHATSTTDIVSSLYDIVSSGLPCITVSESNSVILYNVKNYIDSGDNVLHIDYVIEAQTNRIHSEFLVVSENGSNNWKNTKIYNKMVDSLVGYQNVTDSDGVTTQYPVPDTNLISSEKIGIADNPRQSMFNNNANAVKK